MHIRYDNEKLTAILKDLSILTGISISFLNKEYEPICGFKEKDSFCSAYQLQNGNENCHVSDKMLLEKCRASGRFEYHICHAGLYDAAMPVIKSDIKVGYLLMGRLRAPTSLSGLQFKEPLATLYGKVPFLNDTQLSSLQGLLSNILFSNAIEIEYNELAEEIGEFICSHLTDKLSISLLCKKFFLSKNCLYKCFRNNYNTTVNEYILQTRLEHAKKLLIESNETISSISEKIGIHNVSYFCRTFKNKIGVTPSEYRCNMNMK